MLLEEVDLFVKDSRLANARLMAASLEVKGRLVSKVLSLMDIGVCQHF
jgi:hypothetical protein